MWVHKMGGVKIDRYNVRIIIKKLIVIQLVYKIVFGLIINVIRDNVFMLPKVMFIVNVNSMVNVWGHSMVVVNWDPKLVRR